MMTKYSKLEQFDLNKLNKNCTNRSVAIRHIEKTLDPITHRLILNDPVNLAKKTVDFSGLNINEIYWQINTIKLSVEKKSDSTYQLLIPNKIFDLLRAIPQVSSLSVSVAIYEFKKEDEKLKFISSSLVHDPVLNHNNKVNLSSTVNSRLKALDENHNITFNKSDIAKLASLTRSSLSK